MTQPQLNQSSMDNQIPYVTVGTNKNGSACWLVIGPGAEIEFSSGRKAFEKLEAMAAEIENNLGCLLKN